MTKLLLILLLFSFPASAAVTVYGCSGGPLSDYCADTPAGDEPVPGFVVESPEGQKVLVPASTDPVKQPKPPAAEPVSPSGGFTGDPTTTTACRSNDGGAGVGFCESLASCRINYKPLINGRVCVIFVNGQPLYAENTDGWPIAPHLQPATPGCPAGYTLTVDTCFADNPREAVDDNRIDLSAGEDGYEMYDDIDQGQPDTIEIYQPTPSEIQIGTKTADGRPQQVSGSISSTGSSIVVKEQGKDGNGDSVVKTTTYQFDASGNHIGTSVATSSGSLQGGGPNGTYTGQANNGTTFPNDYAKTGEAQQAANSINNKLDELLDGEADMSDVSEVPEYSSAIDSEFAGLLGWSLPAHTSTCPQGNLDIFGAVIPFNSQCVIMEEVKPELQLASVVMWLIVALFIVLSA